jgi:hypothetical protein
MFNRLKMYFMILIKKHPYAEGMSLIQRIGYVRRFIKAYGFNKAPKRPKGFTESFSSPWKDAYRNDLSIIANLIN